MPRLPFRSSANSRRPDVLVPVLFSVALSVSGAEPQTGAPATPGAAEPPAVEVVVDLKTKQYEVKVASSSRIQEALRQARPWKDEHPFDAVTHWTVAWRYSVSQSESRFRLKSGHVTVSILITMPGLVFPKITPAPVKQTWRTFIRDLLEHEEGHARIATDAGAAVREELLALGSFESLEALDAAVSAAGNRVIDVYLEKEREFDRITGHGERPVPREAGPFFR